MRATRSTVLRLIVVALISVIGAAIMGLNYMQLPSYWFGVGHYQVTVQLPAAGGLYSSGNVTYRGVKVGRVDRVELTDTGVAATLSLQSDTPIPSDVIAEVHSVSAVGEQYVALLPQSADAAPLKNGDVIAADRTSVPPDINSLLDATDRGLRAIPQDNLRTAIDEGFEAFGGLGPEMTRIVRGSTSLAIDARKNLDEFTNVIDKTPAVLDTQTDTSDAVRAWASHLATITAELRDNDEAVRGVLTDTAPALDEIGRLFDRVKPTIPVLMANLVSVGQVAVTYRDGVEQLLVLFPHGTEIMQGSGTANRNTKVDYRGGYLSFNLNLNVPPPCTTGFLPAQQRRSPTFEDYPDRPTGDLYCRVPQDSMLTVRGARNTPCVTRPGKRAPTVALCESDEEYVPLNDGYAWKGDPNATMSGQGIPQMAPGSDSGQVGEMAPAADPLPPVAVASYDPATGMYVGPDGKLYKQADLTRSAPASLEAMMLPPRDSE
ncbi:MCE family protein [Mycolicibacterium vaccae]|uniref:MCE family protein n=1 Tax=Mycolicibacterium vaccae TaxID=1810 RepID=UPI003D010A51